MERNRLYLGYLTKLPSYKVVVLALMTILSSCDMDSSDRGKTQESGLSQNEVVAQPGDGIYSLLRKGGLSADSKMAMKFKKINNIHGDTIISGHIYIIPESDSDDSQKEQIDEDFAKDAHRKDVVKKEISKTMVKDIDNGYQTIAHYHKEISIPILDEKYIIALAHKESQGSFSAVSRTGARGYGQLKKAAISDVTSYLHQIGINHKFDPIYDPQDHCFYVILYFSLTQQKLLQEGLVVSTKDDLFDFTLAAYNAGTNKVMKLYYSSRANTREEYATYITKKLMKIKEKPFMRYDSQYQVSYKDRFGGKDLTQNKNTVIDGVYKSRIIKNHQGYKIVLDVSKAYEFIRYVEVSNAILNTHVE